MKLKSISYGKKLIEEWLKLWLYSSIVTLEDSTFHLPGNLEHKASPQVFSE